MCGIVGFQDYTRTTNIEILTTMRDTLSHRGPDDCGNYFDKLNSIGLGNRRLSVTDLSPLGHQPMSNKDQLIWVTYNGEIYNYIELRQDLINKSLKNIDPETIGKLIHRCQAPENRSKTKVQISLKRKTCGFLLRSVYFTTTRLTLEKYLVFPSNFNII